MFLRVAILVFLFFFLSCIGGEVRLVPYEPGKFCKEPLYIPANIPDSKAVSVRAIRAEIEKNNRDCLRYIQDVALQNTKAAESNKPNTIADDARTFSYGAMFLLLLETFIYLAAHGL